LRLPVIFHWNEGSQQTEGGFTCDVALDGAMIRSSRCPPVGSDVRIEVLLPAPYQSGEELRIHCTGRVIRMENHGVFASFAVVGDFRDEDLTQQAFSNRRE
jgi:hypothetical protein